MRKLLAAIAVAAFALTSAAPLVQAAEMTTTMHKPAKAHVHKVAQKKKAKKSPKKKVSKTSLAVDARLA